MDETYELSARTGADVKTPYRAVLSVTGGSIVAPKLVLPKPVLREALAWDLKDDGSTWRRCGIAT